KLVRTIVEEKKPQSRTERPSERGPTIHRHIMFRINWPNSRKRTDEPAVFPCAGRLRAADWPRYKNECRIAFAVAAMGRAQRSARKIGIGALEQQGKLSRCRRTKNHCPVQVALQSFLDERRKLHRAE